MFRFAFAVILVVILRSLTNAQNESTNKASLKSKS